MITTASLADTSLFVRARGEARRFPPSRLSLLSASFELPLSREAKLSVPAPLTGRIVSKCRRADSVTISRRRAAIAAIFKCPLLN